MYRSLQIKDFSNFNSFNVTSEEIKNFKKRKENTLVELKKYLLDEKNLLSAELIQKHLFPQVEADIFLSHAHADENKVIALALCLEKIGFKVFVDSCIWGNANDLLKTIDDSYSGHSNPNSNDKSYSYEARNFSTSNVYMILNTALHRMIEKSELFIFLGTENSISLSKSILQQESLESPWIFSELTFVNQVRRYDKRDQLREKLKIKTESSNESLVVKKSARFLYPKPTLDFVLSNDHFENWLLKKEPLSSFNSFINNPFSECDTHIKKLENLYSLMEKKGLKRELYIDQQFQTLD